MPELVVLIGPPGSGKSTLCAKQYSEHVRVSQDDQGKSGHMDVFKTALAEGKNIIVDRMNFNFEQRARYVEPARLKEYEVRFHVLYVPSAICLARMLVRADHPTIKNHSNAMSALNTFFTKFEYPEYIEYDTLEHNYYMPIDGRAPAIICDLDGTLCDIEHRLHFVRGPGKKNWKEFFSHLTFDHCNKWCNLLLHRFYAGGHTIVFCSGRGEDWRSDTEAWLDNNFSLSYHLYMRPKNDFRDDALIKEIILDFELLPHFNILFSVDDRKRVVDMWRRRGITCLQCAEGNF